MKTIIYSTKAYDRQFFTAAAEGTEHELVFLEDKLTLETVSIASGHQYVCAFVNDDLSADVLNRLADQNVNAVALRCAGFNNVDLKAAQSAGISVVRVPAYSPHAVAEHTVALLLSLNRNIHRAYNRVRDGNFSLSGMVGFDVFGRTVGVIGTGTIGFEFARIMSGFGCRLLGHDQHPNSNCLALGMKYVDLNELLTESDILSLHCPLTPDTHHLINADAIKRMKPNVTILNTSRGAVIDTTAVIDGLKRGKIGRLGLDVYEEEGDFFFEDLSSQVISDDTLARLFTFPNVLITGHQAFLTTEALTGIAKTTLSNIAQIHRGDPCENSVEP